MDRFSRLRRYREEKDRGMDYRDYAPRRMRIDRTSQMTDYRRDMGDYPHEDYNYDMARNRRSRDYGTRYPFAISGEYGRYDDYPYGDYARGRYTRDYNNSNTYMDSDELQHLIKELMKDVDDKDKPLFSEEAIKKRTSNLGMDFKDYSFEEFYAVVLMLLTDYSKTLGTANIDTYLKMAKDWLCDDDTAVKYGEKLATYYDSIIMGM